MMPFARLSLALCLAAAAAAQEEVTRSAEREPAEKPAVAKAPFVFEAGDVELKVLLERCSAYLQRNILLDDVELQAAQGGGQRNQARRGQAQAPAADAEGPSGPVVTLTLPVVTDRDGCEELLSSILWSRGLALVPLDEPKGVYEVLSMIGQRAREIPMRAVQRTPEQVLARPTLRQYVTVVHGLEHTNATIATNALRPFFASAVGNQGVAALTIGNVGNATAIVLSGPQDMVANALGLLRAADVPQKEETPAQLEQRLDALAKQGEQMLKRIGALEQKLAEKEKR